MYQMPNSSNFKRNLDAILHRAEQRAKTEKTKIQAEALSRSAIRTIKIVTSTVEFFDELHKDVLNQVMNLMAGFMNNSEVPLEDLASVSIHGLEDFAGMLRASVPATGFKEQAHKLRVQYAAVWQERLNEAIHDIETGFVNGVAIHAPRVSSRTKSEKFGILDSPNLFEHDLAEAKGALGVACVYLDIDNFKALNTKYSETRVDKYILPDFQRLISSATQHIGYAYAEGGDEIAILFPNITLDMAKSFIDAFREKLSHKTFIVNDKDKIKLQISVGLAHMDGAENHVDLKSRANTAMRSAKAQGKDQLCIYDPGDGILMALPARG